MSFSKQRKVEGKLIVATQQSTERCLYRLVFLLPVAHSRVVLSDNSDFSSFNLLPFLVINLASVVLFTMKWSHLTSYFEFCYHQDFHQFTCWIDAFWSDFMIFGEGIDKKAPDVRLKTYVVSLISLLSFGAYFSRRKDIAGLLLLGPRAYWVVKEQNEWRLPVWRSLSIFEWIFPFSNFFVRWAMTQPNSTAHIANFYQSLFFDVFG